MNAIARKTRLARTQQKILRLQEQTLVHARLRLAEEEARELAISEAQNGDSNLASQFQRGRHQIHRHLETAQAAIREAEHEFAHQSRLRHMTALSLQAANETEVQNSEKKNLQGLIDLIVAQGSQKVRDLL